MKMMIRCFAVAVSLLAANAQERTPPTLAKVVSEGWEDVGRKLIEMAQEFPEDKYNYKPSPEVRTFAEQVLHAATGNLYLAKTAHGEKVKYTELARDKYPAKADVVLVLKQSFNDVSSMLKTQGDELVKARPDLWIGFLEHAGEHYGQLVVYYRLNGIVPPESRPKPKS
jgi:hypothetical protein